MAFNPNDFSYFQNFIEKNTHLIERFFGYNPFGDEFLGRMSDIDKKPDEKDGQVSHTSHVAGIGQPPVAAQYTGANSHSILMDMIQRRHEILLVFEIPGLNGKEDINIKVVGNTLIVEGEIKRNYLLSNKENYKFERNIGHFSKKVVLPIVFDSKRIRAKYNQGLLEIRIPIVKANNYEKISVRFTQDN